MTPHNWQGGTQYDFLCVGRKLIFKTAEFNRHGKDRRNELYMVMKERSLSTLLIVFLAFKEVTASFTSEITK
jgi:hypothetical protein